MAPAFRTYVIILFKLKQLRNVFFLQISLFFIWSSNLLSWFSYYIFKNPKPLLLGCNPVWRLPAQSNVLWSSVKFLKKWKMRGKRCLTVTGIHLGLDVSHWNKVCVCLSIKTGCIFLFWFEHAKPFIFVIRAKCILYSGLEPKLKVGMKEHYPHKQ